MTKINTIMCSIDSSSNKTGVAVWKNGELEKHHLLDFSQYSDSYVRLPKMITAIHKILNNYSPTIVVIEGQNDPQNIASFRMLCKILGVVQGWCVDHDCFYSELSPSVWRAAVKSKGEKTGRKRDELKAWGIKKCKELFGVESETDDVSDSILVGYAYIKICEREKRNV